MKSAAAAFLVGVLATVIASGCATQPDKPPVWVVEPGEEKTWTDVIGYIHHRDSVDVHYMVGQEARAVRLPRAPSSDVAAYVAGTQFQILCDLGDGQKGWVYRFRERDLANKKTRTVYQIHVRDAQEYLGKK